MWRGAGKLVAVLLLAGVFQAPAFSQLSRAAIDPGAGLNADNLTIEAKHEDLGNLTIFQVLEKLWTYLLSSSGAGSEIEPLGMISMPAVPRLVGPAEDLLTPAPETDAFPLRLLCPYPAPKGR